MKSLKKLKKLSKKLLLPGLNKLVLISKILLPVTLAIGILLVPKLHDQFLYSYKGQAISKIYVELEDRDGNKKTASGTAFQLKVQSGKVYTITNKHVCDLAQKYTASNFMEVLDYDGNKQAVRIIKIDTAHDLCALEPMSNTPYLTLGKKLMRHEEMYLVGHPGGRQLTLSKGHFIGPNLINVCMEGTPLGCSKIVSRVTEAISSIAHGGNSGSPIMNSYGNVVGVLFAGSGQAMDSHMVPFKFLKEFTDKL